MGKKSSSGGKHYIYKGKQGAIQFSMSPAYRVPTNKYEIETGCVWCEVAPVNSDKNDNGNFTYDWVGRGFTVMLGPSDITSIVGRGAGQELKIFHDPGNGGPIKSINISPGTDGSAKFAFYSNPTDGSDKKSVSLYLSAAEEFMLKKLLMDSMPDIIGWHLGGFIKE